MVMPMPDSRVLPPVTFEEVQEAIKDASLADVLDWYLNLSIAESRIPCLGWLVDRYPRSGLGITDEGDFEQITQVINTLFNRKESGWQVLLHFLNHHSGAVLATEAFLFSYELFLRRKEELERISRAVFSSDHLEEFRFLTEFQEFISAHFSALWTDLDQNQHYSFNREAWEPVNRALWYVSKYQDQRFLPDLHSVLSLSRLGQVDLVSGTLHLKDQSWHFKIAELRGRMAATVHILEQAPLA